MEILTPYEKKYRKAVNDLRARSAIQVTADNPGEVGEPWTDNAEKIFHAISEHEGVRLDPSLQRCFMRFEEVASSWRCTLPDMLMTGEFHIRHLYRCFIEGKIHTAPEDLHPEDKILHELRVIDHTPITASGILAGLRISTGATNPEIWYYQMKHGGLRMELDYCAYMDALLVTKGCTGWQYLFTDRSLVSPSCRPIRKNLERMLTLFPELFPEHDYTQLAERLEERLR